MTSGRLPDFLTVVGDEDGGVAGECRHPSHADAVFVAYLGWSPPQDGTPVARDLNDLIAKLADHGSGHSRNGESGRTAPS